VEAGQFVADLGQSPFGSRDFFLELVATLAFGPGEVAALAIKPLLLGFKLLEGVLAALDVVHDTSDERQHFLDGFEAVRDFGRLRGAGGPISLGAIHGGPPAMAGGPGGSPLLLSYVGFQVGAPREKEVLRRADRACVAHPRVPGSFGQRPKLAKLEKSMIPRPFAG
jgi:hypothetical protein